MSISLGNKRDLRVVKTVTWIVELNENIKSGQKYVIRPMVKNPDLCSESLLLRNLESGCLSNVPSRSFVGSHGVEYNYCESEWELIRKCKSYARERSNTDDWAAYILPQDVQVGERLYIEDLIEDILMENFWGSLFHAPDGEAVWNGQDLELDLKLYNETFLIG